MKHFEEDLNPIERFKRAIMRAREKGVLLPEGTALATVGANGCPSLRMMLLKGVDDRGFTFYTNMASRKARELMLHPHASLCFWWPSLEEQVRVEGEVEIVEDGEADTYFATRPRGSQIGAWVSRQSEILSSRDALKKDFGELEKKYAGKSVPRPPFWSGFLLKPERIEFWFGRPDRLHDRVLYARKGSDWIVSSLYP